MLIGWREMRKCAARQEQQEEEEEVRHLSKQRMSDEHLQRPLRLLVKHTFHFKDQERHTFNIPDPDRHAVQLIGSR